MTWTTNMTTLTLQRTSNAVCMIMLGMVLAVSGLPVQSAVALTFKSDGTVEQSNRKSGSMSGKLGKSKVLQTFDVMIDADQIANLKRLPNQFDFSNANIWTDFAATSCQFEIKRRMLENKRVERLARGKLTVSDGVFEFGENYWRTGGMATPEHLKDEANLRWTRGSLPIGKMPYFHLFINQGEVALPPLYVQLAERKAEGASGVLAGLYEFYVDDWQDGLLELKDCRPL
jgi:hypothetical protein